MLAGKQYVQMRDTLARDLTNTDSIAMKMVGDKMIDVYALNMNYETYNIEHETRLDTSFSLYNHDSVERLIKTNPAILPIPKPDKMLDYKWNKQHLQSALTQGILQGESITKIAKRFQNVSGMDERAAIRNARTAMTGAQNGGRLDAMERANENGVEVKKGWMATLDDRTRDSHVELDGEEREIDEEFSNGVMFPGDPEGEPAEVYNCRCRMIHVYPKHPVDWSDLSLRNTDKLGDMTYEEWKNKHKEVDDG
jgi:SPP1 gp7 family putative phage head morphogenesis protein